MAGVATDTTRQATSTGTTRRRTRCWPHHRQAAQGVRRGQRERESHDQLELVRVAKRLRRPRRAGPATPAPRASRPAPVWPRSPAQARPGARAAGTRGASRAAAREPARPSSGDGCGGTIRTGRVTYSQPAGHTVRRRRRGSSARARYPRKDSNTLAMPVVTAAFSIQSRNGGLYRPSSTSGTSHQIDTATTQPSQPTATFSVDRSSRRVISQIAGRTSVAPVATALTPPTRRMPRPTSDPPPARAGARGDEWQQYPRSHRDRPYLDRGDRQLAEHAGAQCVEQRHGKARPRHAVLQGVAQLPDTEERDAQDQGPPQALGDPVRHRQRVQ